VILLSVVHDRVSRVGVHLSGSSCIAPKVAEPQGQSGSRVRRPWGTK